VTGPDEWKSNMGCGFVILCIGLAVALVIVASAWARCLP
jgi:hypothetical protein